MTKNIKNISADRREQCAEICLSTGACVANKQEETISRTSEWARLILVIHSHAFLLSYQIFHPSANSVYSSLILISCPFQTAAFSAGTDKDWIINAVGIDRAGIVSEVTGKVIDAGGNVCASQAARMGKHFSLLMLCTVPGPSVTAFQSQLQAMPGINIAIFEADQEGKVEEIRRQTQIGCTYLSNNLLNEMRDTFGDIPDTF